VEKNQAVEIKELASDYRKLVRHPFHLGGTRRSGETRVH